MHCIDLADIQKFSEEQKRLAHDVWVKFRAEVTKFTRRNPCSNSVGYSHLKLQLSVLQSRWDERDIDQSCLLATKFVRTGTMQLRM